MSDTPSRTARITTIVVGGAVAVAIVGAAFWTTRPAGAGDDAVPTSPTTAVTAAPTPEPTTTTGLATSAPIESGLTARITSMKAVTAKATQPGQVGGPAVRFAIRLTNGGSSAVDLSSTVVNVYYGVDGTPAYQLDSDGVVFPSAVAAGRSVSGTAVFTLPKAERGNVTVTVDTSASAPVVAFTGAVPTK